MFDPFDPRTLDQLMIAADAQMYENKRARAEAASVTSPAA
jgi:hypothetical protein